MSILAPFLALFLLLLWKLDFLATLLNLKALKPTVPPEFAGTYDPQRYLSSQEYTRVTSQFHLVSSAVSLFLLLGFWFCRGFVWLDELVLSFSLSPIPTGLFYLGFLFLAQLLLSLPFEWYSTFVIEKKFGFNKTSPQTFIADQGKSLLLTILLGGPFLAVLLWIFYTVPMAWLWAWGFVTLFSLLLTYLAPTYIMPLFNTFSPLEDGPLKRAIHEMAQKCQFPLTGLYVIDGSKRSTKANAFFTGFGKRKKIALYDTLLEEQSDEEIVGVLAHEIGHFKQKHILQKMALSVFQTAILFYLIGLFTTPHTAASQLLFEAFFFPTGQQPLYAGFALFAILFKPVSFLIGLVMNRWSRKHEFEADHYAQKVQGTPEPLIRALKKLSSKNLSNLTPHPLLVFLEYSHPPVLTRIAALRNAAKSSPEMKTS